MAIGIAVSARAEFSLALPLKSVRGKPQCRIPWRNGPSTISSGRRSQPRRTLQTPFCSLSSAAFQQAAACRNRASLYAAARPWSVPDAPISRHRWAPDRRRIRRARHVDQSVAADPRIEHRSTFRQLQGSPVRRVSALRYRPGGRLRVQCS